MHDQTYHINDHVATADVPIVKGVQILPGFVENEFSCVRLKRNSTFHFEILLNYRWTNFNKIKLLFTSGL